MRYNYIQIFFLNFNICTLYLYYLYNVPIVQLLVHCTYIKMVLKCGDEVRWVAFIWLRTGVSGGLL